MSHIYGFSPVCILCQHFFHLAEQHISAFLNILHLLVDMNKMMSFHIILGIKASPTNVAFIRFLSSMYSLMSLHKGRRPKPLVTETTIMCFSSKGNTGNLFID